MDGQTGLRGNVAAAQVFSAPKGAMRGASPRSPVPLLVLWAIAQGDTPGNHAESDEVRLPLPSPTATASPPANPPVATAGPLLLSTRQCVPPPGPARARAESGA